MTDFASTVSESVKQLGQAFLVAYYLPAFVFVLIHFSPAARIPIKTPKHSTQVGSEITQPAS